MEPDAGPVLIAIARAAIARAIDAAFGESCESADWLSEQRATFVTLRKNGNLRGCVGTIEARRALREDVKINAVGAALRDPRFTPVTENELDAIDIEVSVLTPLVRLDIASEEEAIAVLCPFADGIVLEHASARSTFLPQVWGDLPDPAEFLRQLKRKAGLPADYWSGDLRLFRYSVAKWSETARSVVQ